MDRINREMLVLITKPFYDSTLKSQKGLKGDTLRKRGKVINISIERGKEIVNHKYGVVIEIPKRVIE
jgi:hypothetical protein